MNVDVHWGNLQAISSQIHMHDVIEKNVMKVYRLLKRIDPSSIKLEIKLSFDPTYKTYHSSVNLLMPKAHHFSEENGYSLEASLNESIKELRRQLTKIKEKRIDKRRKHLEG